MKTIETIKATKPVKPRNRWNNETQETSEVTRFYYYLSLLTLFSWTQVTAQDIFSSNSVYFMALLPSIELEKKLMWTVT